MKRFLLAFFAVFAAVMIILTAVLINNNTEYYKDVTLNTPAGHVYVCGVFINFAGRVYSVFDNEQIRTEKYIGFYIGPFSASISKTVCEMPIISNVWTVYNFEFMAGPDGKNLYINVEFCR